MRDLPSRPEHNVPMDVSPQLATDQQKKDAEHINLLAIFHFIFAGICILGIGFLFLHYAFMHSFFANPDMWKGSKNPPPNMQEFLKIFIWFYVVFGVLFIIAAILNVISGICLRQRKYRTFSLVIAAMDCLQIPFGTALGIITLIVLMRDSVRTSYRK